METKKATLVELFILSAVSLYFELLVIRWMSADIRAFTIFRTFPLVTCFVGMGAGLALPSDVAFKMCLPALLQFVGLMLVAQVMLIGFWGFPSASVFQWQNLVFTGSHIGNPDWQRVLSYSSEQVVYLFAFILVLILLLAGPFSVCVCIGSRLGHLFNEHKPLIAYSVNLAGAIAGSIIFAVFSFAGWPPWCLLIPPTVLILLYSLRHFGRSSGHSWAQVGMALAIPILAFFTPNQSSIPLYPALAPHKETSRTYWSPYQRIDLTVFALKKQGDTNSKEFFGLELGTNRAFYQGYFNHGLGDWQGSQALSKNLKDVLDNNSLPRNLPYQVSGYRDNVLIVGAGVGEDVQFAINNGARSVDAVEIDPVILQIGRKYNPDYSSPSVYLICDDARHFFNHCNKKYDLIVFGHLDSQVVSGQGSSVRIDSYVYTRESITKALTLLKPQGIICLCFASVAPWTRERLYKTVEAAAGYTPICTGFLSETIIILGTPVRDKTLKLPLQWPSITFPGKSQARVLTDDWPYLYVDTNVIDFPYLLVTFAILALSIYAGRRLLFKRADPGSWQMFFLGSAFMLLELHAISSLSLLYGSTWITSAIVINCILLLLLGANFFVMRMEKWLGSHLHLVYALLFVALGVSYFVTPSVCMSDSSGLSYAIVTFCTILPLGLAGIIFSTSFSLSKNSSRALAFNLFGSVVGGLLEYLSNYTGIRGLVMVGGLLYLSSFICWTRRSCGKQLLPGHSVGTDSVFID